MLDLDEVCPAVVQLHAERDYELLQAKNLAMARRLGYLPNLDPLAEVIGSKTSSSAARESLRALGEDGWWTQSRLLEEVFPGVTDDLCRACSSASGTLWHRCVACPVSASVRDEFKDQDISHDSQSALYGGAPLFRNGIPPRRTEDPCPPFIERRCGGDLFAADEAMVFWGNVFTDGAMRGPALARLRRAGWAAVCVNHGGLIINGLYGTCQDVFPTAFRAELLAVERVLLLACPPITIHVDNQGVIDGIGRGSTWCCASARPAADIWRRIWWRLEDIGTEDVHFVKVKGHATDADIDAGRTTWFYMTGNSHADHFAGLGVTVAEEIAPVAPARQAHDYAKRWYKWLLRLACHWPDDAQKSSKSVVSCVATRSIGQCTGASSSVKKSFAKKVGPRHGIAIVRAKVVDGFGHSLMTIGDSMLFCKRCAKYSGTLLKGLRGACDPDPLKRKYKRTVLTRLLEGRHPVSRVWLGSPVRFVPVSHPDSTSSGSAHGAIVNFEVLSQDT